jgi:hypothetical protein
MDHTVLRVIPVVWDFGALLLEDTRVLFEVPARRKGDPRMKLGKERRWF